MAPHTHTLQGTQTKLSAFTIEELFTTNTFTTRLPSSPINSNCELAPRQKLCSAFSAFFVFRHTDWWTPNRR